MDVIPGKVIQQLSGRKRQLVDGFVNHPRNQQVLFSNSAFFCVEASGKHRPLAGLLPTLRKTFWPDVDMKKILKAPKQAGGRSKTKKKMGKRAGKALDRFFGSIRGSQVHQELEDFILLNETFFLKKHQTLHPWTKRILTHIVTRERWQPLISEFAVHDSVLGVGTAIDMVCVDREGKLIFLEFKTGYRDYFRNHDGFLSHSLCFMRNSPMHWATIQLVFSVLMVLKHFGPLRLEDTASYVIRVDEDDLECYPIKNDFIRLKGADILADVERQKKMEG